MPTLRFARADELPPEERAALELLARRMGSTTDQLAELAGCVMHDVAYNTIAHGMRLEPPYHDMTAAELRPR